MTRVLFQQNQWEWRVSQTKKDCAEFFELEKKNGKSPKNQPPSDDADEDYDATRNPPNWECASLHLQLGAIASPTAHPCADYLGVRCRRRNSCRLVFWYFTRFTAAALLPKCMLANFYSNIHIYESAGMCAGVCVCVYSSLLGIFRVRNKN